MSVQERFWSKVQRGAPDECWPWTGYVQDNGYGKFTVSRGVCRLAHRVAYELTHGPIPEGLVIDHVRARGCSHRHCVNPAHLEAVTMSTNIRRGDFAATVRARCDARTHCKHGHPLTEGNTYAYNGERRCRTCMQDASRRHYEKTTHAVPVKGAR